MDKLTASTTIGEDDIVSIGQSAFASQLTAVVAPMVHAKEHGEKNVGVPNVAEEEFQSATDFLNSTYALEYLDQAVSAGNSSKNQLYRDSLYVKFDPLLSGTRSVADLGIARQAASNKGPAQDLSNQSSSSVSSNLFLDATSKPPTPSTVVIKKPCAQVAKNSDLLIENSPNLNFNESEDENLNLKAAKERIAQLMAENCELQAAGEKLSNANQMAERKIQEFALTLKEYEAVIGKLKASSLKRNKKVKDTVVEVSQERDNLSGDLQSAENVIAELMKRNEKLRSSVTDLKKNEHCLRQSQDELMIKLQTAESRYCQLRDNCEEQLIRIKTEKEEALKTKESEVLGAQAKIRKFEIVIESLEQECEQKGKQIRELSSICDELIKQAGREDR